MTSTPAHSVLIVATTEDVEQIGAHTAFEQQQFPHFHCGGLDVGIFGQLFWEQAQDKAAAFIERNRGHPKVAYSSSSQTRTVVVYALPARLVERYARLADDELKELAQLWSRPNGRIHLARSADFYEHLLREVAHLARIATRDGKCLLLRTEFGNRGPSHRDP